DFHTRAVQHQGDLAALQLQRVLAEDLAAPPSVVELLKVLLKAKSDNAGVASKLIATVSDLEKIAISDDADIDAMKGWRRQIFGEDALKLKRGEIALVLNGARVEVVEIE
ncbi:hypothetical protein OMR07_25970, partial [Methylobacterium organophilum]|nr:hypothetical protein [Methylobacterium organophilum]